MLNPAYRKLLTSEQTHNAMAFIKVTMITFGEAGHYTLTAEPTTQFTCTSVSQEETHESQEITYQPAKWFKHLSLISELLELEENNEGEEEWTDRDKEIQTYLGSKHTTKEIRSDSLNYWINNKHIFPLLYPIARSILCTPASTAPVERVFSTSGECTRGKRNRISDDNLERETLLLKNKHYL